MKENDKWFGKPILSERTFNKIVNKHIADFYYTIGPDATSHMRTNDPQKKTYDIWIKYDQSREDRAQSLSHELFHVYQGIGNRVTPVDLLPRFPGDYEKIDEMNLWVELESLKFYIHHKDVVLAALDTLSGIKRRKNPDQLNLGLLE